MDAKRIERLCEARARLRVDQDARLDVIAREACVSPFHFIREFESLFGETPHQSRITARLDQARILLARGEHSVTEVCMELGMSSLGSFSDWFVKRTGVAPREYQRRARVMVAGGIEVFPGCLSLMGRLPADAFRNFREARGQR
jgi:AraC-like DNA-binding protein